MNKENFKFCRDCKFCLQKSGDFFCTNDCSGRFDLVTGIRIYDSCQKQRNTNYVWSCGEEAQYFRKKD